MTRFIRFLYWLECTNTGFAAFACGTVLLVILTAAVTA